MCFPSPSWNFLKYYNFFTRLFVHFTKFFDIRMFLNSVELFLASIYQCHCWGFPYFNEIFWHHNLEYFSLDIISKLRWTFLASIYQRHCWDFLYFHKIFWHQNLEYFSLGWWWPAEHVLLKFNNMYIIMKLNTDRSHIFNNWYISIHCRLMVLADS